MNLAKQTLPDDSNPSLSGPARYSQMDSQPAGAADTLVYINATENMVCGPAGVLAPCDPAFSIKTFSRLIRCEQGAAAIEFAFIMPVLLLLLMGVICYGGYFWMAHDVQQLANDAARAAIAGLDSGERSTIANTTVQRNLSRQDGLVSANTKVAIQEGDNAFTVTVSYDASTSPYWMLVDLLPMPSKTIDRSATVTLGGY